MHDTVVFITAHAFEARAAAALGGSMTKEAWGRWTLYRGEMWDLPTAVIRCGPGKVAAAAAAQAAAQYLDPRIMLSFGVAGSYDPRVKVGSLVVAERVVDVALQQLGDLPVKIPTEFEPDPVATRSLLSVPGTRGGTLLCWEGHIPSPVRRPQWDEDPQRVAVDWESASVAQVAGMWDVPWAALKVISDHGERDRLRMLALVAKRPLQWGAEVVRRGCAEYARQRPEATQRATAQEEA